MVKIDIVMQLNILRKYNTDKKDLYNFINDNLL